MYLKFWCSLHHLQCDVATNRMSDQYQLYIFWYILFDEVQLMFYLSVESKNILQFFNICVWNIREKNFVLIVEVSGVLFFFTSLENSEINIF